MCTQIILILYSMFLRTDIVVVEISQVMPVISPQ